MCNAVIIINMNSIGTFLELRIKIMEIKYSL